MSWLERIRPALSFLTKKETPDNLWIKDPLSGDVYNAGLNHFLVFREASGRSAISR